MVGTWGQLLFPKPWKEFRLWYDAHKAKGIKPFLQGMVSTGWYKKMGERIWTPWFIKFIQSRGYYNIYTNFLHEKALSISHRDAGVNYGRSAGPDSSLLNEGPTDFNIWEMPPLTNLRWYDFCFSEVYPGRVVGSYEELGLILSLIQKQRTVVLISLYRTEQRIARNLLCHLERLGLRNFILVGGSTEFLMDLARRGYPVIVSDRMVDNIRNFGSTGNRRSEMDMVKEISVKAGVIRKSLELGFDTWVVDGNIIPLEYPFSKPLDTSYSFFAAEEVELMMVKSSRESLKVWVDDFISEVVSAGKSLMGVNSFRAEHRHFAYIATKALEKSAGVKVLRLDESAFYEKIGNKVLNRTSLERGKKMVFLPRERASVSVQRELESLELWLIDEESSCVAVVCHQS